MTNRNLSLLAAVAVAVACAQPAAAGPQQYKLTPFTFVAGHGWITLYGVNNSGQVAGTYSGTLEHDSNLAAYWNVPSNPVFLRGFGHGTRGAFAVNNQGVSCGFADTAANDAAVGGIYWENGQPNLLRPATGQNGAICMGINDSGLAVGNSDEPGNVTHATEWAGYDVIDLGALGGKSNDSYALAVNNSGVVVGYSYVDYSSHPTAWINRKPIDLGSLGGPDGHAEALNDAGQIVGYSYIIAPNEQPEGFQVRPFVWSNGTMTQLPVLGDNSDGFAGEAKGISASGVIVGQATSTSALIR